MSTTQFRPTPLGQKTERMKEVEQRLGRTLEEDYQELYWNQNWGQKRLADRWGVKRSTIFGKGLLPGRRGWVQMLNLETRTTDSDAGQPDASQWKASKCPLCDTGDIMLDSAHWIPREQGGPTEWWNIAEICPNCHRRLDSSDEQTTRKLRTHLISKAARDYVTNRHRMTPEEFEERIVLIIQRAMPKESHNPK